MNWGVFPIPFFFPFHGWSKNKKAVVNRFGMTIVFGKRPRYFYVDFASSKFEMRVTEEIMVHRKKKKAKREEGEGDPCYISLE